jgi:hypothetical protein
MMFLQARNKEAFLMLAEKNEKIRKAYNILEIISKDDNARAAYESREAEIHDQMTRLKSAREEGLKEGLKESTIKNAKNFLLMRLGVDMVAKGTGLSVEEHRNGSHQNHLTSFFRRHLIYNMHIVYKVPSIFKISVTNLQLLNNKNL